MFAFGRGVEHLASLEYDKDCTLVSKRTLPAEVLLPDELVYGVVPYETPVMDSIPQWDIRALPSGIEITGAPWSDPRLHLRAGRSDDVLTGWSLSQDGGVVVLRYRDHTDVHMPGTKWAKSSFVNLHPWRPSITHAGLVGGRYLVVRGVLDSEPAQRDPVWLRVYDLEDGERLVAEVDARELEDAAPHPWMWPEPIENPDQLRSCTGGGSLLGCDGEVVQRTFEQLDDAVMEFSITVDWGDGPKTCRRRKNASGAQYRAIQHDRGLLIFGLGAQRISVSSYDAACESNGGSSWPASVLEAAPVEPHSLPLPMRELAYGVAVGAENPEGCETNCNGSVDFRDGTRSRGFAMVGARSLATGVTPKYVWWVYDTPREWAIYVARRGTLELVHSRLIPHSGGSRFPVQALRVDGDILTIHSTWETGTGVNPLPEIDVYDLESGDPLVMAAQLE